jgi:hypothetical protein
MSRIAMFGPRHGPCRSIVAELFCACAIVAAAGKLRVFRAHRASNASRGFVSLE